MKLNSALSILALGTLIAFGAGLAFNTAATALFALAASVLVLLIASTDYRTRRSYGAGTTVALRRRETMPLAA